MRVALGNKHHPGVRRFVSAFTKLYPTTRKFKLKLAGWKDLDPTFGLLLLSQIRTLDRRTPILVTDVHNIEQAFELRKNGFVCVRVDAKDTSMNHSSAIRWDYVVDDEDLVICDVYRNELPGYSNF